MTRPQSVLTPPCCGKPSRLSPAPPADWAAQWYMTHVRPSGHAPEVTGAPGFPRPAQLRPGAAWPRACQQAWMISRAGAMVFIVIGAGGRGLRMLPSGATISTERNVPSLRGMSAPKKEESAVYTPDQVLATELFLKPRICGCDPEKSTF